MTNQNTPKAFLILTESKINDESIQTVNARLLWKWIESKSRFNDWIKRRIQEGRFQENKDFITVLKKMKVINQQVTTHVGDPIEYYISLDMAKHLAMMERNDKGFEARQYFIQCERELLKQQRQQFHMPHGYPQMLEAARNDWKGKRNELIQCLSDHLQVWDRKRKSLFTDLMYMNIIETRAFTLREHFGLVRPQQLTRDFLHQYPQEALCELECRLIDGIISGSINCYSELIEAIDVMAPMIRSMKEFQTGRIPLPTHAFPIIHAPTRH